ncbi:MAG: hypothetical protein AB2693_12655, partial [Candidatus Thiodiazotropha sp.]
KSTWLTALIQRLLAERVVKLIGHKHGSVALSAEPLTEKTKCYVCLYVNPRNNVIPDTSAERIHCRSVGHRVSVQNQTLFLKHVYFYLPPTLNR